MANWIGEAVLGGTAQRVLARADLPVLLVRRAVSAELSCILLATDFSDNATRAAQLSLDWFPDVRQRLLNACTVAFEGRMRMAGVSLEHIEGYRRDELARAEQRMEAQMQALRSAAPVGKRIVQGYRQRFCCAKSSAWAPSCSSSASGGTMLDERLLGSVQNLLSRRLQRTACTLSMEMHHVPRVLACPAAAAALAEQGTTSAGLSAAEAAQRLASHGPNRLTPPQKVGRCCASCCSSTTC